LERVISNEEDSAMRSIIIVAVAASAALAGCTFKSTTVRRAEVPPPATVVYATPAPTVVYTTPAPTVVYQQPTVVARAPTVAYAVAGQAQFNQAAVQAAAWCRTNHGIGAQLLDTRRGTTGDVVTFECIPS
jgi:hypothetical protein